MEALTPDLVFAALYMAQSELDRTDALHRNALRCYLDLAETLSATELLVVGEDVKSTNSLVFLGLTARIQEKAAKKLGLLADAEAYSNVHGFLKTKLDKMIASEVC